MSDLKWWGFEQNNSGGYWIEDENVGVIVFVQGTSLMDIAENVSDILEDYREYCDCCGERWDDDYVDEEDGTEIPIVYGESIWDEKHKPSPFFRGNGYILYYANGNVTRFNPETKEEIVLRDEWL